MRSRSRERVLYSFCAEQGCVDGANPYSGLIFDAKGSLYGTTTGGASNDGNVFKLTPSGSGYTESVLYSFKGGNDGSTPFAGLTLDGMGALYGTTSYGGGACDCGTVFKLSPSGSGYTESILHSFNGGSDGEVPAAGVILDTQGAIYGTTSSGGTNTCYWGHGSTTCGTVFRLRPSRSGYAESVIHSFQGGNDGDEPVASLVLGRRGTLYGMTPYGGAGNCRTPDGIVGCGVVFELARSKQGYTERVLYSFSGAGYGSDGQWPLAGLVVDAKGALYGTTSYGGTGNCYRLYVGCGTVFKLKPSGKAYTERVLYRFHTAPDGNIPSASLIFGANGALYSTAYAGGACCGTVFELKRSRSGYSEHTLYRFTGGDDGLQPVTPPIFGPNGALYGTTWFGGIRSVGTVFELKR